VGPLALKPGDIFLTENPMALGRAINAVQRFWSKDHHSVYSHAGIIIDEAGSTYESLWRVRSQNLYEAYKGNNILIARHEHMLPGAFNYAFKYIKQDHDRDFYPFYRLTFHLFPPLAKICTRSVVCSELVAKFLHYLDMFPFYNGCTPDDLHDHIVWGKGWKKIYKGQV